MTAAGRAYSQGPRAVIERHRTPGRPPRVRCVLTGRGRALEPVVHSMWEWGSA
ncbi:winged helix-turn-helix transcriptional regulator [Streptomyces erythrochromogenes]|uniref:winged helix-turn-helix transcriptional regulator n=1 Tax=Streptomyces erythrochromogenes TaxID=285574 RepID=UPI0036A17047